MKLKYLENLHNVGVSLDFETDRIQRGLLSPPAVVGSLSWFEEGPSIKGVLPGEDSESNLKIILDFFEEICNDPEKVLIGANIAMFDLLVAARELAKRKVDIMPALFKMLEEGRVYDVQIAQALHDIAMGHLGNDPRTNGPIINPETGIRGRYSLAYLTDLLLNRQDAKSNAKFKQNYADLRPIPFKFWEPEAYQYPIDDTNNTHEVALAQTGHMPKVVFTHNWGKGGSCRDCGSTKISAKCFVRRPHRNLHDLSKQTATAFSMFLGAARGFRVNQASVDIVERHAIFKRERLIPPFIEAGIIRADGTVDEATLKRKVAIAYGAKDPCPVCNGTGKVPSSEEKTLRCDVCKGRCKPWKAGGKIKDPTVAECKRCDNTGRIPHPNPKMVGCAIFKGEDKIKTCDGTGLLLTEDVPRSDKEGVGKGRDACHESGDDFLISYGDFLMDAKDLKDYIPYLREARMQREDGTYYDIPLTLRPNPVLETGRVSYNGYIQLFKRAPGYWEEIGGVKEYVPSLRECIEARPGYYLASIDYDSGELVTHAQNTLWTTGQSKLAEALNSGLKVHNQLGASMIGMSYEEFTEKVKTLTCKNARQAAKPGNFGYLGGMGPVKMALQQRIQGPDTPHPHGPIWIRDPESKDPNKLVRGYRGLRFCILMDDAPACGIRKTTEWKGQKIKPTCVACIECSIRLRELWLQTWPENTNYFKFINSCMDYGQQITSRELDRWPWLKEVYAPGTQLAPGEIMQHHSGRIRGGLTYTQAANGFTQGLLGDLAKNALRQVSRECYDKTYRVPSQWYHNSKVSKYAGAQSPLYGSHVIVFQHDELLPELIQDNAHDAAMRISEIMIDSMRFYCPDMLNAAKAPPALMRVWTKSAEPFWKRGGAKGPADDNDTLVPWEEQSN